MLCLAGWVEYPYSQTNYAAATAGVALEPPVLERLRDDGSWQVIEPDPGYPAGLPRLTTLDLTGKLTGDRCVLRLRTNMDKLPQMSELYKRYLGKLDQAETALEKVQEQVKSKESDERKQKKELEGFLEKLNVE